MTWLEILGICSYVIPALAWIGEMIWLSIQEVRHPERFKGPD